MKNILGTTDDLELFHKDGDMAYRCFKDGDGPWEEYTYYKKGYKLIYKYSEGYWTEYTYDEMGSMLTYKDSDNYWEEYTYDEKGNELTYKGNIYKGNIKRI